jgi:hypothetical protein
MARVRGLSGWSADSSLKIFMGARPSRCLRAKDRCAE